MSTGGKITATKKINTVSIVGVVLHQNFENNCVWEFGVCTSSHFITAHMYIYKYFSHILEVSIQFFIFYNFYIPHN